MVNKNVSTLSNTIQKKQLPKLYKINAPKYFFYETVFVKFSRKQNRLNFVFLSGDSVPNARRSSYDVLACRTSVVLIISHTHP